MSKTKIKTQLKTLFLLSSIFSTSLITMPIYAEEAPPAPPEAAIPVDATGPIVDAPPPTIPSSSDAIIVPNTTDPTAPAVKYSSPLPLVEDLPNNPYYSWMTTEQKKMLTEKTASLALWAKQRRTEYKVTEFLKKLPEDPSFKKLTKKDQTGFNDCMNKMCRGIYSTLSNFRPVTITNINGKPVTSLTAKQKIDGIMAWIESRKAAGKLEEFINNNLADNGELVKSLIDADKTGIKACLKMKSCKGIYAPLSAFIPDYTIPGQTELPPEEKLTGLQRFIEERVKYASDISELSRYIENLQGSPEFSELSEPDQRGFNDCMKSKTMCNTPYQVLYRLKPNYYTAPGQTEIAPMERLEKMKAWVEERGKFAKEQKDLNQYIRDLNNDATFKALPDADKNAFNACMASTTKCPAPYEMLAQYRPDKAISQSEHSELSPSDKVAGIAAWIEKQSRFAADNEQLTQYVKNLNQNESYLALAESDKTRLTNCVVNNPAGNSAKCKARGLLPFVVKGAGELSPEENLKGISTWVEAHATMKPLVDFIEVLPTTAGFTKLSPANQKTLSDYLKGLPAAIPENARELAAYHPETVGFTAEEKVEGIKKWITSKNGGAAHAATGTHAVAANTKAGTHAAPATAKAGTHAAPATPKAKAAPATPKAKTTPSAKKVNMQTSVDSKPAVVQQKSTPTAIQHVSASTQKPVATQQKASGGQASTLNAQTKAVARPTAQQPTAAVQQTMAQESGFGGFGGLIKAVEQQATQKLS